jgi:hypothetical protein
MRARRAPVTLADLTAAEPSLEPAIVLRALAAAIDPAWTAGQRFAIAYELAGPKPATHHFLVADGSPVVTGTGLPPGGAAATVGVAREALLPLLARLALPPGERATVHGDLERLALLHRWTDRVQGIPEED